MKKNCEIRANARRALKGHWLSAVGCIFVFVLITLLFEAPSFIADAGTWMKAFGIYNSFSEMDGLVAVGRASVLLILFFVVPLGFGLINVFLECVRGRQGGMTGTMFRIGFAENYWRGLGSMLLTYVYIFLWTLLLFIPGLVKAYSYSMTSYLVRDFPEMSVNECINMSRRMMKGRKFKLFLLDLSFIGWALLCLLTAGIGTLWLFPYMYTSRAVFYEELRAGTELYGQTGKATADVRAENASGDGATTEPYDHNRY